MKRYLIFHTLMRYDIAAFLLCIFFFLVWPQFDLYVSQYFYDRNSGGFFWGHHIIAESIYRLTHIIGVIVLITLPLMIAASWLINKDFLVQQRKNLIYHLSVCILGPGLLVNLVLKGNWGRPRPRQILEYGGDKLFEAPFFPSFECLDCHSFVSGHASVGFCFFCLALLSDNKNWLWLPAIAGTIIGAGRIVQGGHFFSDVMFSGWGIWFCSLFLYTLFFKLKIHRKDILD